MVLDGNDGEIERFATLSGLGERGGIVVTYLTSARFAGELRDGGDIAVVTRPELRGLLKDSNIALLVDGDAHDAFYTAFASAAEGGKYEQLESFRSPKAKVHPMAAIAESVHIEAGAVIGASAVILPNTYVGADVVIKPNATVGGDGYENAVIRGRRSIVPHAGGVWLCEGVCVGSSVCIDRGLFGDFSLVGPYTTIDNLVHVAHSVRIGKNCSLTACSEMSGAVVLGDGVWLAPNVSVNQGLTIGDHCYLGTGAVVTKNLPPYSFALGSPARVMAHACVCRAKLQFENGLSTCGTCGKKYRQDTDGLVQRA
jgi:UDP-3-O-[3-hydroxymyristoyl] glucosamine N-acyltransferase